MYYANLSKNMLSICSVWFYAALFFTIIIEKKIKEAKILISQIYFYSRFDSNLVLIVKK